MNITNGFDRIFGPSYIYVNRDGDLQALLADAEGYAQVPALLAPIRHAPQLTMDRNSSFAADFYDEVAEYIEGYTPTSGRGDFNAILDLPERAGITKAVLSMNGADMQDNVDYSEYPKCLNAIKLIR